MHNTKPGQLLMIHTSTISPTPIVDSLTRRVTAALRSAKQTNFSRGTFVSEALCPDGRGGPASDNAEHHITLPNGRVLVTNSLAIHYIAHCRAEVPASELAKIKLLPADEAEPTAEELWPGA